MATRISKPGPAPMLKNKWQGSVAPSLNLFVSLAEQESASKTDFKAAIQKAVSRENILATLK